MESRGGGKKVEIWLSEKECKVRESGESIDILICCIIKISSTIFVPPTLSLFTRVLFLCASKRYSIYLRRVYSVESILLACALFTLGHTNSSGVKATAEETLCMLRKFLCSRWNRGMRRRWWWRKDGEYYFSFNVILSTSITTCLLSTLNSTSTGVGGSIRISNSSLYTGLEWSFPSFCDVTKRKRERKSPLENIYVWISFNMNISREQILMLENFLRLECFGSSYY